MSEACAVCGGVLQRELLRITQPDRFERHVGIGGPGYSRAWVECGTCGAASNIMDGADRARLNTLASGYYEVDFAGSSIAEKFAKVMAMSPAHSDNAQRVARVHEFLGRWLDPATRSARALDIGAGTGVFLSRFLDDADGVHWSAHAVEPDPVAAGHLRSLGRFEVTQGLFSRDASFGRFDLVTLNKVVEHLADPIALVEAAAGVLGDAGVLYLELPDRLTIDHRPPSDNILGALHFHLYDPASIGVLLERAGLAVLKIERVFEPSGKISVAAFAATARALGARAARGAWT